VRAPPISAIRRRIEAADPAPAAAEASRTEASAEPAAAPVRARCACRQRRGSDPDIPDGTEMVPTTVREALRDAMAEEMRANGDVFVMGEEVAEYQGAYKITQGLLTSSAPSVSSTRRSPSTALPALVSARR
jgi:pyruvate dehydrogenase E1 component beta subunit